MSEGNDTPSADSPRIGPVPTMGKIAFKPEMIAGLQQQTAALEERITKDARSMLAGAPGYIRVHVQTSGRTPVNLRADRIHAYAPLGDGTMEVFSSQHVWKVAEHYLALERILGLDQEFILGLGQGMAAALERQRLQGVYNALMVFLPAAVARK